MTDEEPQSESELRLLELQEVVRPYSSAATGMKYDVDLSTELHDLAHWVVLDEPLADVPASSKKISGQVNYWLTELERGAGLSAAYMRNITRKRLRGRLLRNEILTIAVENQTVQWFDLKIDTEVTETALHEEFVDTHDQELEDEEVWRRVERASLAPFVRKRSLRLARWLQSLSQPGSLLRQINLPPR